MKTTKTPSVRPDAVAQPCAGQDGPIQLPDHIRLSERELASVTRLVRLMRRRYYWLGGFIEYLLYRDFDEDGDMSAERIECFLLKFKNLRNWRDFIDKLQEEFPVLTNYAGIVSAQPTEYCPVDVEDGFQELVKLWRREHPEPEKPRRVPAGHLGREESGD